MCFCAVQYGFDDVVSFTVFHNLSLGCSVQTYHIIAEITHSLLTGMFNPALLLTSVTSVITVKPI